MEGSRRQSLVALLLGSLAALLLAELVLRAMRPDVVSRVSYPCFYEPDPELGFRYRPGATGILAGHFEIENEVRINSLGFHDEEPLPEGEVELRVLALGDSFTAAMHVPRSASWPAVLERELRRSGAAVDVVNLGVDGTGTDVHVELLRRHLPRLAPRLVILAFYRNDLSEAMIGGLTRECYRGTVLSYPDAAWRERLRTRADAHEAKRVRRRLYDHSYLVRLVVAAARGPVHPYRVNFLQPRLLELPKEEPSRARARLASTLEALAELSRSCDCRLVVAPMPPKDEADGSLHVWRGTAGGLGLELVDALPVLARLRREEGLAHADLYFERDNHLNARGQELFGRALAELLAVDPAPGGPAD